MKLKLSNLPKEERERIFSQNRRLFGIKVKRKTIPKKSIERFCDNFICLMKERMEWRKKTLVLILEPKNN